MPLPLALGVFRKVVARWKSEVEIDLAGIQDNIGQERLAAAEFGNPPSGTTFQAFEYQQERLTDAGVALSRLYALFHVLSK